MDISDERKEEIWAEIDAIYKLPEREVGDIDAKQIEKRYNVSERTALRILHELEASGEYELIVVKDATCSSGKRMILRKAK
jgi:Mn-dependent DtxR family transcriptional regulator